MNGIISPSKTIAACIPKMKSSNITNSIIYINLLIC
jgi:hypothetical protein